MVFIFLSKQPNFLSADERDVTPSNHSVGVPDVASSPNYSYEMWLRLKCTVAPNSQCTNFKFWGPATQPDSDDTPGDEMTVLAGTTGTGATPTDSASTVATTAQHSNYFGPGAGEFLHTGDGDGSQRGRYGVVVSLEPARFCSRQRSSPQDQCGHDKQ